MFKKAIPLVIISGIALAGCGTNNTVPKNNETPMEDNTRDWTPEVRDEQTGPNMDGLNNGNENLDRNGVNEGIMKDNGTINNGNTGTGNGVIQEGTTSDGLMENDLNPRTKNNNNNR